MFYQQIPGIPQAAPELHMLIDKHCRSIVTTWKHWLSTLQ